MGSHSAHPKRKTQYTVVLAQHLIRLSQKSQENLAKSICSIFDRLISGQPTEIMWCPLLSSAPCFFEHRHMTYEMGICFICCSSQKQRFIEILSTWAWRPQLLPKRCVILGCSKKERCNNRKWNSHLQHWMRSYTPNWPKATPEQHQSDWILIQNDAKFIPDRSQARPAPKSAQPNHSQTTPNSESCTTGTKEYRTKTQWDIMEYSRIPADIYGYAWISIEIHAYPHILVNNLGYPKISMDIHGHRCTSGLLCCSLLL